MDNSQCPSCSIKTGVEHERFWRVEVDEVDYFLVDRDALLALADEIDGLGLSGFSSGWSSGAVNVGSFARRIREALGAGR